MTRSLLTVDNRRTVGLPDPVALRQRLIRTATYLIITRGFAATSIQQITDRARVPLATCFSTKLEIGHAVSDALFLQTLARIQGFHPADLDELITELVTWTEAAIAHPGWVQLELALAAHGTSEDYRSARRAEELRRAAVAVLATACNNTSSTISEDRAMLVCSAIVGFVIRYAHDLTVSRAEIEAHIRFIVAFAVA